MTKRGPRSQAQGSIARLRVCLADVAHAPWRAACAAVVVALLAIMGPQVGNVFSQITFELENPTTGVMPWLWLILSSALP